MIIKLFLIFLKIGTFTIGGGFTMFPFLEDEIVDKHKLMAKQEFYDLTAICQSAPGVVAVNMAVYIGQKLYGWKGAFVATLGAVLPSFVIILLIAILFNNFAHLEIVKKIFSGMRPSAIALLTITTIRIFKNTGINIRNCVILTIVVLCILCFKISPVYLMLIALILGSLTWYKERQKK